MQEWNREIWIALTILFLLFGSFLNVVGLRVVQGKSIIRPRSLCPSCKTTLGPLDLVPVFSYLWNLGKCRHCGVGISPVYPLGEIAATVTGLLLVWRFGYSWELLVMLVLFMIGIIVSVSDVHSMRIPNKIIGPGIIVILLSRLVYHPEGLMSYLLGALLGGGLLFVLAVIYPKGMGMGDVKLFFLMGLGLGWIYTLVALFLASLLGSLFGLLLFRLRLRKKGEPIPFGPFIVLASLIAAVWGTRIWTSYWNLYF